MVGNTGLISNEDRRNSTQVPGLANLPVAGRLFQSKDCAGSPLAYWTDGHFSEAELEGSAEVLVTASVIILAAAMLATISVATRSGLSPGMVGLSMR